MKKARAPDLTAETIAQFVDLLDCWQGKLTWDALTAKGTAVTGIEYSRFTLLEHTSIANAFTLRKEALRGTVAPGPRVPRDERVKAALEQVDRYRNKVKRLESENQLLTEQFVTWAVNAERKGVTIPMLNAPLPKPPRDRTKGEK